MSIVKASYSQKVELQSLLPATLDPQLPLSATEASLSKKDRMKEWTLHLLLLSLTAAAMWFVVTEGWVRLLGMWTFGG
ncbi:MAG: hypothetical protein JOZ10_13290 [Acidobacteria bacterium]|nr:hypothetical protein [Acidobacteriota bacterium]MBV9435592.1 hypothetical protein [Acidobacteriota bacterium]